jgi:hypothetical protein
MLIFLKQSTASQSRMVGPFIDDTDFKTVETALTINNTDVKLSKNGAASADKNSGGGTHRANGMYSLTFDATDSDTVGELGGSIKVAGALAVTFKAVVVEEAIYDSIFAASAAALSTVTLAQVDGASDKPVKNAQYIFSILMKSSAGTPLTGLTVSGFRALDGATSFTAMTGAIAEKVGGLYKVTASAADMNGDSNDWKFTATGAADRFIHIETT